MERINNELREHFPTEIRELERAADRARQNVETERATLFRQDGTPTYAPEAHAELEEAIYVGAAAEFDQATRRVAQTAEQAIAEAERDLAQLAGADGWEALSAEEQQRAATRRELIKED